jgi:hypothetical protein
VVACTSVELDVASSGVPPKSGGGSVDQIRGGCTTSTCPRSLDELQQVSDEMLRLNDAGRIESNGLGFSIDAATCSVLVEGALHADAVAATRVALHPRSATPA